MELFPLKGHNVFSNIYEYKDKLQVRCGALVVSCIVSVSPNEQIFFGVTIGKRIAKRAVIRNRIKRLLRESMRVVLNDSNDEMVNYIEKIILSYKSAPQHPSEVGLKDILPLVHKAFGELLENIKNKKAQIITE